jgi:pentatricopeptide repeat domain-containing protein 1
MKDCGVAPSGITYGIMIKGYGKYKCLDNALSIYLQMKDENISLNDVTFGCLIDACVRCG